MMISAKNKACRNLYNKYKESKQAKFIFPVF